MEVLVSNIGFDCATVDPQLVNPYGIVVSDCYIWVSSVTKSLVIKYDMKGKSLMTVSVPSPTGLCLGKGGTLYIASNSGTIYTLGKGDTTATLLITLNGTPTSVGGIAFHCGKLYVSVVTLGYVQEYDVSETQPKEVLAITDDTTAAFEYKPIGLTTANKIMYITYGDSNTSQGFGYVNSFTSCGVFRLINRGFLANPYSTAICNDELYVANGNGYIQVYSLNGEYIGRFDVTDNIPFFSDGLRSIYIHKHKLYYVAATNNGLMGNLGVVQLS